MDVLPTIDIEAIHHTPVHDTQHRFAQIQGYSRTLHLDDRAQNLRALALPYTRHLMKAAIGISIVWTIRIYNVGCWLRIPAVRSQMLPDLAMIRGTTIALPIVHDVKAGNETALSATRAPCKHHGSVPYRVTPHLAKGRHKRVCAFDCLM